VRVLTWNLYHGRDFPPEGELLTPRSQWLRVTEIGGRYAQVNRPLRQEFAAAIARMEWEVALLQEVPPRWQRDLGIATGASAAMALTSRNFLAPVRAALAEQNTDLIASDEGGSNQVLARPPWRIAGTRRLTLARRPERRRMLWVRLEAPGRSPVCVANMHLSTGDPRRASREVLAAAARAVEWAGDVALVFGGDLNLRPGRTPEPFERLRAVHGFEPPPDPEPIDHLFARGLAVAEAPRALPSSWRELPGPEGRLLRLSDHDPVAARFSPREAR